MFLGNTGTLAASLGGAPGQQQPLQASREDRAQAPAAAWSCRRQTWAPEWPGSTSRRRFELLCRGQGPMGGPRQCRNRPSPTATPKPACSRPHQWRRGLKAGGAHRGLLLQHSGPRAAAGRAGQGRLSSGRRRGLQQPLTDRDHRPPGKRRTSKPCRQVPLIRLTPASQRPRPPPPGIRDPKGVGLIQPAAEPVSFWRAGETASSDSSPSMLNRLSVSTSRPALRYPHALRCSRASSAGLSLWAERRNLCPLSAAPNQERNGDRRSASTRLSASARRSRRQIA